ncbi:hypothetical protein BDV3_005701 [Batrachochytrium dendrobatidis]|uniref:C2H2-type domain-containing protein n=2 Tax=Batrachochytrium dendrobatidis TaxID=109871 RepID=A0A177WKK7_BATDL|nr:hypothetical protein BDEG_23777 [Batrachochytrium dendrobatidis JEL423]
MTTTESLDTEQQWLWTGPVSITRKRKKDDSDSSPIDLSALPNYAKYYRIDSSAMQSFLNQNAHSPASPKVNPYLIRCNLSPSCSSLNFFQSLVEYEDHYELVHVNVCASCNRVLPTAHLLHLHLQEFHDSFFKVLAETQVAFECFVDECKKKSKTSNARIRHLIKTHGYPQDFDFRIVRGSHNHTLDGKAPHGRKLGSCGDQEDMSVDCVDPKPLQMHDSTLDQLSESMKLLMVPRSVRLANKSLPKSNQNV